MQREDIVESQGILSAVSEGKYQNENQYLLQHCAVCVHRRYAADLQPDQYGLP